VIEPVEIGVSMNSKRLYFVLLSLCTLLLPTTSVRADTGPKPSMEFHFTGEDVTIVSGILYECNQPDCSDAEPLEDLGPQGMYCETSRCRAIAYGFAPYHTLEIEFTDGKTRASNVFETAGFDSKYTVTVGPDDLLVEAQFSLGMIPRTGTFILLCSCALFGGLAVLAGIIFVLRRRAAS
jgi:hypothetical protein